MSADLSCGFSPAVPEAEACKGSGGKQLFKSLVLKGTCTRGLFPSFSELMLIHPFCAKGLCPTAFDPEHVARDLLVQVFLRINWSREENMHS